MQTLTQSGAGVCLEHAGHAEAGLVERLRALLATHRFVVLRGALPQLSDAVALLGRFGPINQAETRKDGAVLVEAARDDEVFRSNHALPLHKDGILTGFDVVFVGIYCVDFEDVQGGRTYVSDATRALEALPPEHVAILREHGVEGMAVDSTGYYRPEYQGKWHKVRAFAARPGRSETLNLGLPHAPGEAESWRVRVAGVPEEVSQGVLRSLREALLDRRRTYFHDWREGDLLLMDNYAVMHGREAFTGRRRRLANIQVLAT